MICEECGSKMALINYGNTIKYECFNCFSVIEEDNENTGEEE